MNESPGVAAPLILSVDDEPVVCTAIERCLAPKGFSVVAAHGGRRAFEFLSTRKPDLILLDVMMPEMNGFEVCSRLQENKDLSYIPVIFLTAVDDGQNKAKAFSYGAVDFIGKPFDNKELLGKVNTHLETRRQWESIRTRTAAHEKKLAEFFQFKRYLFGELNVPPSIGEKFSDLLPLKIYSLAKPLGITPGDVARAIAGFKNIDYLKKIDPADIQLGVLPTSFCMHNLAVALGPLNAAPSFVVSNPFNEVLLEGLEALAGAGAAGRIKITEPENITELFR
jgi:CheY-like chemotaxis protein